MSVLGTICISVPAGVVVRGCAWLQRICFEDSFSALTISDGGFTSAPAHTKLTVQQFLTKNGMTPVPHSPYSHDLAPNDFFFVSLGEKVLKGKCFADMEKMKQKNSRSTSRPQN